MLKRIFNGSKTYPSRRNYAAVPTMYVFDRDAKKCQRERAALAPDVHVYDYLKEEIGDRLADRVMDIKRKFSCAADLGCSRGYVSKHITSQFVEKLYMCDTSPSYLEQAVPPSDRNVIVEKLLMDEESLTFEKESLDMVISCLALHWVNDIPSTFAQVINCLKNDGVFLASLFGGDTLYELRSSLQLAELERDGGVSPHISPFTEVRDLGSLLTFAGFNMLTMDTDEIVVTYPTMFELIWDLKGMGENNAAINRCQHLKKDTLSAAAAIYKELYGTEEGLVQATFQIINFIGWKPDPSQPKPKKRGSAQVSLKDMEKISEMIKKGKINLNEK